MALTARPLDSAASASEWVFRHFGGYIRAFGVVPSRLRPGEPLYDSDKSEFLQWLRGADVLVDDGPENIERASRAGIHVKDSRTWVPESATHTGPHRGRGRALGPQRDLERSGPAARWQGGKPGVEGGRMRSARVRRLIDIVMGQMRQGCVAVVRRALLTTCGAVICVPDRKASKTPKQSGLASCRSATRSRRTP